MQLYYRYRQFVISLILLAIVTLSGCASLSSVKTPQEEKLVRPTSSYSEVDIAQVNHDLRNINDALDRFWRNAGKYMEQDCTPKQNKQGLFYKSKAKQLCTELKELKARKDTLIAQRDGYEQYLLELVDFEHQQRQIAFDRDQTKTRATGAVAGAVAGGVIGNIIDNDSVGTGIGAVVGGVLGGLFGDVIASKKKAQLLTEQQIGDETYKMQKLVKDLQNANTYLLDDIRYYKAQATELEKKARKGHQNVAELKRYSRSLRQAKIDTKVASAKVVKELKLQQIIYQAQIKQNSQLPSLIKWKAEIDNLEKEKRVLEQNTNSLMAISPYSDTVSKNKPSTKEKQQPLQISEQDKINTETLNLQRLLNELKEKNSSLIEYIDTYQKVETDLKNNNLNEKNKKQTDYKKGLEEAQSYTQEVLVEINNILELQKQKYQSQHTNQSQSLSKWKIKIAELEKQKKQFEQSTHTLRNISLEQDHNIISPQQESTSDVYMLKACSNVIGSAAIQAKTAGYNYIRALTINNLIKKISGIYTNDKTRNQRIESMTEKYHRLIAAFDNSFTDYKKSVLELASYPSNIIETAINQNLKKYVNDTAKVQYLNLLKQHLTYQNKDSWKQAIQELSLKVFK